MPTDVVGIIGEAACCCNRGERAVLTDSPNGATTGEGTCCTGAVLVVSTGCGCCFLSELSTLAVDTRSCKKPEFCSSFSVVRALTS